MTSRKKKPYRNIAVVFPNEKGKFYDQNLIWGVNTDLLDMAANDTDVDYVLTVRSMKELRKYSLKLRKEGVQIRNLYLVGHGSKANHHIGAILEHEFDLERMKTDLINSHKCVTNLKKEIVEIRAKIKEKGADKEALKKELTEKEDDLLDSREDFDRQYEDYTESTEVAEVLAPEANVFMYNCYAATNTGKDKKANSFMKKVGNYFGRKNGCRVYGYDGLMWIAGNSLIKSLALGAEDHQAYIAGEFTEVVVPAGTEDGEPQRYSAYRSSGTGKGCVCGSPCKDLERYGLCDIRVKDASSLCHHHG
jgi:hypothetical protein